MLILLLFIFLLSYLKQQGGNLLWIDALHLKLSQCPKQLYKKNKNFLFNKSFSIFSDAATFVYVNIFVRSFSKIDDVKMVRTELSSLVISLSVHYFQYWLKLNKHFLDFLYLFLYWFSRRSLMFKGNRHKKFQGNNEDIQKFTKCKFLF